MRELRIGIEARRTAGTFSLATARRLGRGHHRQCGGGLGRSGRARLFSVAPLGIAPKRRTMVQLRVGRSGLKDLPLVDDADGTFYFKGEGDRTVVAQPA